MTPRPAALALAALLAAPAVAAPPTAEPDMIREVLARDARWQRIWFWSWAGGFATVATAQLAIAGTLGDGPLGPSATAGGVGASLGLIGLAIGSLHPDAEGFADGEPLALMEDAAALEGLLRAQARREAQETGWLPYVLASTVAVGSGLYVWLVGDQPIEAGVVTGVSFLVGGTQIWTAPTGALELWEALHPGVDP